MFHSSYLSLLIIAEVYKIRSRRDALRSYFNSDRQFKFSYQDFSESCLGGTGEEKIKADKKLTFRDYINYQRIFHLIQVLCHCTFYIIIDKRLVLWFIHSMRIIINAFLSVLIIFIFTVLPVLAASSGIKGSVLCYGKPSVGAIIDIESSKGTFYHAATNSKGQYKIALTPGNYYEKVGRIPEHCVFTQLFVPVTVKANQYTIFNYSY
jgi:hypothetical protein